MPVKAPRSHANGFNPFPSGSTLRLISRDFGWSKTLLENDVRTEHEEALAGSGVMLGLRR